MTFLQAVAQVAGDQTLKIVGAVVGSGVFAFGVSWGVSQAQAKTTARALEKHEERDDARFTALDVKLDRHGITLGSIERILARMEGAADVRREGHLHTRRDDAPDDRS